MRLVLSLGLDAKISLLRASRVKANPHRDSTWIYVAPALFIVCTPLDLSPRNEVKNENDQDAVDSYKPWDIKAK
jgi:hypothetical protein